MWEGVVAGYGIAVPVGAIGVLLVDLAIRKGFRPAAAAGTGVASADLVYALAAVLLGSAVADALDPYDDTLRVVSSVALFGVAALLLKGVVRPVEVVPARKAGDESSALGYYFRFLGLTILNPATITYFVALILGLDRGSSSALAKVLFVAGVFLASASWQITLAGIGAYLHKRLPRSARRLLGVVGVLVVAGFALELLIGG